MADMNPTSLAMAASAEQTRELQRRVRALEEQLEQLAKRRRHRLLIVVLGISLLAHAAILLYLSGWMRGGSGGSGTGESHIVEMSILTEQELTSFDAGSLGDLVESPAVATPIDDSPTPIASLNLDAPQAGLLSAGPGAISGGSIGQTSGGGDGLGALSGGGGGVSFFGISSRGDRFAYIMDMSGSMSQGNRWKVATRELLRSISSLPDFTHFYIVLYSNGAVTPPRQTDWMRAGPAATDSIRAWLDSLAPTGGTMPAPAFQQVFALEQRPDVVFFLTDGEIPQDTPTLVAGLNERGQRVVINTVAFGDPTSQQTLKAIADQSGGVYRHVPAD